MVKRLVQRDKWICEGVIQTPTGFQTVCDIIPAETKEQAMEQVFDVRVEENPSYVLQGAVPLLEMIRTLRSIYDEPVDVTIRHFTERKQ